jgi:hypothetical protein
LTRYITSQVSSIFQRVMPNDNELIIKSNYFNRGLIVTLMENCNIFYYQIILKSITKRETNNGVTYYNSLLLLPIPELTYRSF